MTKRPGTRAVALALTLALAATGAAYAQQNRFDYDEDAVRALRYAAWEAGTLFGSAASPYGLADLGLTAARIQAFAAGQGLSDEALAALGAVLGILRPEAEAGSDGFLARLGAGAALEAYPRLYDSGDPGTPWSWAERLPLLSIPIELGARRAEGAIDPGAPAPTGALYARIIVDLREDHNALDGTVTPANVSNWIESADYIDYTFPHEAFIAGEYGALSASFGRDRLRWGPGSALTLSEEPDYYDYLDAALTTRRFSYRYAWISIDPSLRPSELDALDGGAFESVKNLFLHRLEFLPFDRVAVAIVEGLMLGGVEPDLAYANPFLILHNRFPWNTTAYDGIGGNDFVPAATVVALELRVNPWRYAEVYGTLAMNQLQSSYEIERYGAAAIPNAYAWQAGFEAAYPLFGGWLRAGFEYVYTNPWMYIRENRFNSFTWRRRLTSNIGGADQLADAYLGYRYGPDAMAWSGSLGWDSPGRLRGKASLEYALKGEQGLDTAYATGQAAAALKTPTGTPERIASVGLEAYWKPRPWLELGCGLVWTSVGDYGHAVGARAAALDARVSIVVSYR